MRKTVMVTVVVMRKREIKREKTKTREVNGLPLVFVCVGNHCIYESASKAGHDSCCLRNYMFPTPKRSAPLYVPVFLYMIK